MWGAPVPVGPLGALHLGGLHPAETLLTVALTLVPFVLLAVVVTVASRRDRRAEEAGSGRPVSSGQATREDSPG